MPKKPPIGWRDIERALLETFREYAIAWTEDRGERYIRHRGVEYCISDLAKELESRL